MIAPQSIQDAPYSITAYTEHRRKLRGGGGSWASAPPDENKEVLYQF